MRIRGLPWRPLVPAILLLAAGIALGWAWTARDAHRQSNIELTMIVSGATAVLLAGWWVAVLRRGWRAKLAAAGMLAAAGGALAALVRIGGVTGDLVPILEWRFSRLPEATLGRGTGEGRGPPAAAGRPAPGRLDYPQFLGPGRDATLPGVRLARDWAAAPPRLVWKIEIGAGWSGFAVAGDLAFTQEQRGDAEMIACYSLLDGALLWTHGDRARYQTTLGGIGPRATPAVDGDRVYAVGATGILNCLDRRTGRRVWSRDIVAENGASLNEWGMSGSPLVLGDLVVVAPGGKEGRTVAAYRKEGGEPAWAGGSDRAGYASPLRATLTGAPQVLSFNRGSVSSHDPATGRVLWQVPWSRSNPNVAQPLPLPGDRVLVSSGYGVGCALFQVRRDAAGGMEAVQVWKTLGLKAKFANFVAREGFAYGLDDGILACLDLATGERRWKEGRYGHGQLVLAGDLLVVTAESGEVALVEAAPGGRRELGRFRALEEKTWNSPALAAPLLLVRNDRSAACWELRLAAPLGR